MMTLPKIFFSLHYAPASRTPTLSLLFATKSNQQYYARNHDASSHVSCHLSVKVSISYYFSISKSFPALRYIFLKSGLCSRSNHHHDHHPHEQICSIFLRYIHVRISPVVIRDNSTLKPFYKLFYS